LKIPTRKQTRSFFEELSNLEDKRDNRGKVHDFAFVLCGVCLAIMTGRSKPSSIYRYLRNRFRWLRRATKFKARTALSLAQLYRFLEQVSWEALNDLIYQHFQFQIDVKDDEWYAVDGKALRGSPGQAIVSFRSHESGMIVGQERIAGNKESEITAVRNLLEEQNLWSYKMTLDALHLNPKTTAGLHQKGGGYLIQAKDNQETLLDQMKTIAETGDPLGYSESVDKAHGRLEERKASFFAIESSLLDVRWNKSGLKGLVVMERTTEILKTGKITKEISYYVTNQPVGTTQAQQELFQAIRRHWGVESDHWIRDVTFNEDHVKSTATNRGQILALLRTLTLYLFRKMKIKNMQEAIENFVDSPETFKRFLYEANFL